VHDTETLDSDVFAQLARERDAGRVKKIGLSVYNGAQIDRALERFPIDLIQLPLSVLDQRLLRSGHLDRLKERGVEIHARSIFLQGLLFLDPQALPPFFDPVRSHLMSVREAVRGAGHSMLSAAVSFVERLPQIDRVIVGATNLAELEQIIAAAREPAPLPASELAFHEARILDPSQWPAR
jgi:aryl-alcohol dehydrogenase-like predicted oxidoreductase